MTSKKIKETRLHSSRMRTARSSSRHGGVSTPLWEQTREQAPPWPDLPQLPPWVWAWRPPGQIPLVCGPGNLQGMLGYHPPLWTEFLTHASENITLPQHSFAGGKNDKHKTKISLARSLSIVVNEQFYYVLGEHKVNCQTERNVILYCHISSICPRAKKIDRN